MKVRADGVTERTSKQSMRLDEVEGRIPQSIKFVGKGLPVLWGEV